MRVLFVCGRNRRRSPTAERIFDGICGVEACSAGVSRDAEEPLTTDQIEWAELVVVMERPHRAKMARAFGRALRSRRVCVSACRTTTNSWRRIWSPSFGTECRAACRNSPRPSGDDFVYRARV